MYQFTRSFRRLTVGALTTIVISLGLALVLFGLVALDLGTLGLLSVGAVCGVVTIGTFGISGWNVWHSDDTVETIREEGIPFLVGGLIGLFGMGTIVAVDVLVPATVRAEMAMFTTDGTLEAAIVPLAISVGAVVGWRADSAARHRAKQFRSEIEAAPQFEDRSPGEVVESVRAFLDDDDPQVRREASYAVITLGYAGSEVVTEIIDDVVPLLEHDELRVEATWALGAVAIEHPDHVVDHLDRVEPSLTNEKPYARNNAVWTVGRVARAHPAEAEPLWDCLEERLDDECAEVRANAAFALTALSGHRRELLDGSAVQPATLVTELTNYLTDGGVFARQESAEGLETLASVAPASIEPAATPLLDRLTQDPSEAVRRAACDALLAIVRNGEHTALEEQLQDALTTDGVSDVLDSATTRKIEAL